MEHKQIVINVYAFISKNIVVKVNCCISIVGTEMTEYWTPRVGQYSSHGPIYTGITQCLEYCHKAGVQPLHNKLNCVSYIQESILYVATEVGVSSAPPVCGRV